MGLDANGTKFLIHAKSKGVNFARTATIGRQRLHLDALSLKNSLSSFGYDLNAGEIDNLISSDGGFAEAFLRLMGAVEVSSFDASDYEGASHIIDFNLPVDAGFKNRFTALLDGGTLEHIFNFPAAIRNCMEMLEVGGHFLSITPANNFVGHGFYQFSPELFFRIFNKANGFRLVQMMIFEDQPEAHWFEVNDPDAIRERVTLVNNLPTYLLVIAQKVEAVPIFAAQPQQSDYVSLWEADRAQQEPGLLSEQPSSGTAPAVIRSILSPIEKIYRRLFPSRQYTSLNNPKFFKKMR